MYVQVDECGRLMLMILYPPEAPLGPPVCKWVKEGERVCVKGGEMGVERALEGM